MLESVQKIISEEFGVAENEVTLEANLRNDLHIDSMAAVNLSFEIEGKFDIKITDDELAGLVTVADIITLLETKDIESA